MNPVTLPELRSILLGLGVSPDEYDRAVEDGTLPLLAVDHLVLPEPARYTQPELAERAGISVEQAAALWRSLGFPDPRPGDRVFTETDLEMLHLVNGLVEAGVADPGLAIQMSRVIGSSIARIANAQVDAIEPAPGGTEFEPLVSETGALLPVFPRVLEYVWRRHLQAAARRRLARETGAPVGEQGVTVGFADLVGFTSLSQQVTERELAEVVDRFETMAYEQVHAHGGRVVKIIGDEVMFVVDDPKAAAVIGLSLSDAYRESSDLSDVRVGLACGPVLEREGDAYGTTVNLASRITSIAYAGSVVASSDLHDVLAEDEDLTWRSMRPRYLKDIGRVTLWVLRWAGDDAEETGAERRRARRSFIRQEIAQRLLDLGEA
jgi:adenylate cyclase